MVELALFGAAVLGFILGALLVAWCVEHDRKSEEEEQPTKWFVRFAYRRVHYGNYAPPTQWYHTYRIIEAEDADKLYDMVRTSLLFPSSKDSVEVRILDIHEI